MEEGLTFVLEWTLGVFTRLRGKRVLPGPKSHSNVGLFLNQERKIEPGTHKRFVPLDCLLL